MLLIIIRIIIKKKLIIKYIKRGYSLIYIKEIKKAEKKSSKKKLKKVK